MDEKKYLCGQIKACRQKLNLAKLLDNSVLYMAVGGVAAVLLEAVSLFWPFYYVHIWAAACVAAGLVCGIILAIIRRSDMKQAAGKLDSFGLKERVLTAYENLEEESSFARLQRKDAVSRLQGKSGSIRIPLLPDRRHLAAFGLSMACAVILAFLPTTARDIAREQHAIQQQAKEKEEELEKLIKELEDIDTDSLTEEQRAQIEEMIDSMKLSMEELKAADSREALAAAEQRLDYKYQQTADGLQNLASQISDPSKAGIASAQQMAAAAGNSGQQTASANGASASGGDGQGSTQSGNGEGNGGTQSGNGADSTQSGSGNGDGDGDGSGSGNGDGNGSGNGNGNGSGNGDGSGNGSGGNGSGTGGSGRGTGSSDDQHDYVSVANKVGDDDSATGKQTGSDNSDYYRAQNGLAWEGEHVSLDSVIADYTQDAYDGISTGKYPSGMENVIKDYFENLNN